MEYTFGIVIDGTMDEAEMRVTTALAEEGFGVLTRIDVAATLKAKIDVDREPYVILGACNPALAHRAIQADRELGALLPCNVVLRKEGEQVAVRFMDPGAVVEIVAAEGAHVVMEDARERLTRVAAAISN
jgi:uncharacterized protein (DUF302 family)